MYLSHRQIKHDKPGENEFRKARAISPSTSPSHSSHIRWRWPWPVPPTAPAGRLNPRWPGWYIRGQAEIGPTTLSPPPPSHSIWPPPWQTPDSLCVLDVPFPSLPLFEVQPHQQCSPGSTLQCEATAPSCLHFRGRGHVKTAHGSALPKSRLQVEHSHGSSGVTGGPWSFTHLCSLSGRGDRVDQHSRQHLNDTKPVPVFSGVHLMIRHFGETRGVPLSFCLQYFFWEWALAFLLLWILLLLRVTLTNIIDTYWLQIKVV